MSFEADGVEEKGADKTVLVQRADASSGWKRLALPHWPEQRNDQPSLGQEFECLHMSLPNPLSLELTSDWVVFQLFDFA